QEAGLREDLLRAVNGARDVNAKAVAASPGLRLLYKVDEAGNYVITGKTCTPAVDDQALRDQLARIKTEVEQQTGGRLNIPATSKGISRSVKIWSDYAHLHPFLGHWIKAQELAKLLQFFTQFQERLDLEQLAGILQVPVGALAAALKLKLDADGGAQV